MRHWFDRVTLTAYCEQKGISLDLTMEWVDVTCKMCQIKLKFDGRPISDE